MSSFGQRSSGLRPNQFRDRQRNDYRSNRCRRFRRDRDNPKSRQRIYANCAVQSFGRISILQLAVQSLSPDSRRGWIRVCRGGCQRGIFCADEHENHLEGSRVLQHCHRRCRRSFRKRHDHAHRPGPQIFLEASHRKPIVVRQFAGHADVSRRGCGLQWTLPWVGRSRLELFFRRWPAHYRSAEQSVLQSNPR